MAYSTPRTWVAGEYPTAAQLNANLRDNLNAAFPLGVDAWTSYTPTLTQSGAVTKTVAYAKYQRVGRLITVSVYLQVTGAGTGANGVVVGLPVAAAYTTLPLTIGVAQLFDQSAAINYPGILRISGSTTATFVPSAQTATNGVLGNTLFTAALANLDEISYSGTYEAAT